MSKLINDNYFLRFENKKISKCFQLEGICQDQYIKLGYIHTKQI